MKQLYLGGLAALFFLAACGGVGATGRGKNVQPGQPSAGQAALQAEAAVAINTVPATQPADRWKAEGVEALFYDSVPWHGKPTRVFAWVGYPPNLKADEKVPAVVLVHGGGGTAFAKWVRIWTSHGYAAIAMDTCGQLPHGKPWDRDTQGGPPGWGGFDETNDLPSDQWTYHAAIDVILANSLLRSMPHIDTSHIGLVGISWGGYLTCICAGLDDRYAFAVPVYGCGFLDQDSAWVRNFQELGPQKAAQWLAAWDPSHYLPGAHMPLLWVDGTNDVNYPFEILQESYRLPPAPRTLVTRVRMHHSHSAGWAPPEIYAFADSICKGAAPLAHITGQSLDGRTAAVRFTASVPLTQGQLNYTKDDGDWKKRKWVTTAADVADGQVSAPLPEGTTAYFFNLTDQRGLLVSSECATAP